MKQFITQIQQMTLLHAQSISTWKYQDEYSIYSFEENAETIAELLDGTYYSCTDQAGNLIGYFCYGKAAQIPILENNVYSENRLDIGLGIKPELCGHGLGEAFLRVGLGFAYEKWKISDFRLSVAAFNKRAQKVYEKVGFACTKEVTHRRSGAKFWVMEYIGLR